MSIFGKLWKGVKKIGGSLVKIVKKVVGSKKTKAVVDASQTNDENAYYDYYKGLADKAEAENTASGSPPSSSGLSNLLDKLKNGPIDLNRFITLPNVTVTADKKQANWLMIGGLGLLAALLLFKRPVKAH
jgi:hypothetical protein